MNQLFPPPYSKPEPKKAQVFEPFFTDGNKDPDKARFVYWNSKLTHQGITVYKVFEGFRRHVKDSSLDNLLNQKVFQSEIFVNLLDQFKSTENENTQKEIFDQALSYLNNKEYANFLQSCNTVRTLSPVQSRQIRKYCSKLFYYSQTRRFTSKKSGVHQMRVAFLTLTTPSCTLPAQSLKAFEHFLDYLSRTANCNYVWKKELGDKGNALHFHIMLNNFIPYYIVAWKWKRLLINEGVIWDKNEKGQDTSSHYRIELPRSQKSTGSYIAKYMSKGEGLPSSYGYISGHSKVLDILKETQIIVDDLDNAELERLCSKSKVIRGEYVSLICTNLLHCQKIAPRLYALFLAQYLAFSNIITMPQKFVYA